MLAAKLSQAGTTLSGRPTLTAIYGTLRFMVRIDASKTQCFQASLRIYAMQTHDATRHPVGPVPLRHLTAPYGSLRFTVRMAAPKPNVSGLPYGFTARRHMVLLPCPASSSFHAFLPRRLVPP